MPNRLIKETSPYLLQHADNPVDWYPWGEEALVKAKETGKPILLSIGYSACHWCHVMAHESFESPATAAHMNKLYVNIKVDREERPDLDKIYQTAHQLLTQAPGGWPLTMFLTSEQVPFFGGTYFPPAARHGMPGFVDVLTRAAAYYDERGDEVAKQGAALLSALQSLNPEHSRDELNDEPLKKAREIYEQQFDSADGGFGSAPKFPHPGHLDRLLRHWRESADGTEPDVKALFMASLTLMRMAQRGLYDQLGGGFFRYSVDAQWSIPHFEKMLYDNAALLATYSDAYAATAEQAFHDIAIETAAWVLRDMQHPEGGFYGTLDADSADGEGRFYLWSREELEETVDPEDAELTKARFGLDGPPNFEGASWHLFLARDVPELASKFHLSSEHAQSTLERTRARLLAAREKRPWPGRDEKILTGWNGLMIRGLAVAARRLGQPAFADAASNAADFLRRNVWQDNSLRAVFKDGQARFNGYLDDYVFLADGLFELLQYRWRAHDLEWVLQLLDGVLAHFSDEPGGFFFTARDHEPLIHRPKHFSDDATPAGNGVAAHLLLKVGHLVGDHRYLKAGEAAIRSGWGAMCRYPQAHESLLSALEEYLEPHDMIVVRGEPDTLEPWGAFLNRGFFPRRRAFLIPTTESALPGLLNERKARVGGPTAYVCRGSTCLPPVQSIHELAGVLGTGSKSP